MQGHVVQYGSCMVKYNKNIETDNKMEFYDKLF